MVVVLDEPVIRESVDDQAFKVFIKSLEILGGPRKLVEYRNLTWVPSLMAASYAVVLHDKGKTAEEIAEFLGMTKQTVKRMLSADPEEVMAKLRGEVMETDEHTAGGIAKEAWRRIKAGEDINIAFSTAQRTVEAIGPAWAVLVLTKIRGVDFPITEPSILLERLKGIEINGKPVEEIIAKIEYPVRSPAELLHKMKKAAESQE
ncbi:MAG: bacterio-opsin activator [Candidatus Diapherotrites archaeon]|nr:bacterio-opsin activator [Candidatus Diapherotrites archaeon]